MTVFRFALIRGLRRPLNIVIVGVLPLGAVFLPFVPGRPLPLGFYLYGMVLLFSGFLLVRAIFEDGLSGVLVRVAMAPIGSFRYLGESLLAFGLALVFQSAVVVGLGVLVYGTRLPAPLELFALYSMFALTSVGFSLAWCSMFREQSAAYVSLSAVLQLISAIGGFYWPVSFTPPFMQRIAMLTPCYWMLDALEAILRGASGLEIGSSLGILSLFTVAFLLVGSRRRIA